MSEPILVIEDNEANLELMVYLLRAFGYAAIPARDGEEGLAAAAAKRPALVLCDVQLPGLDGYGVLRRLKANPQLRDVPVVAVTALAMSGDRERILEAGFQGYLSKPVDPETFVERLLPYLPGTDRRGQP